MRITIDDNEYWTRREYLPKKSDVVLPPADCQGRQLEGGKWVCGEAGAVALYRPNREDILAIPAVRAHLDHKIQEAEALNAWFAQQSEKRGRRKERIGGLVIARETYAGLGTRMVKLRLNTLAKTSSYAKALRLALEIEDLNVNAKRYHGGDIGGYSYSHVYYLKEAEIIEELIEIAKSEGWTWGVLKSDVGATTHVIYFNIPGVGQVSWH
jgi:hypothetical protein